MASANKKEFLRRPPTFVAAQHTGPDSGIAEWLNELKYPWLKGDYDEPDQLVDEDGDLGQNGLFLGGEDGTTLIVRSEMQYMDIDVGDWVVFHENGAIGILTNEVFRGDFILKES